MRIVAGSRKGARIFAPRAAATRPTSDRVRESVFSMIGSLDGEAVLDLFAGSGAMGLEALSRGAGSAVFVESGREAVRAIERNLEKLGLAGARVVRSDATRFLATERGSYDLVFVDPPYELVESLRMSLAADLPRVLAPGGLLVYESAAALQPTLSLPVRTSRRYGSTRVTLFENPRSSRAAPGRPEGGLRPSHGAVGEESE